MAAKNYETKKIFTMNKKFLTFETINECENYLRKKNQGFTRYGGKSQFDHRHTSKKKAIKDTNNKN